MQIVTMSGLSYPTVRGAIDLFEAGGWGAIRPAVRGRARGDGRVLSQAQEDTIQRLIIDKRPEQLKMDFSLWSRAAVGQLIEQEFGITLQVRSIGKYLKLRDAAHDHMAMLEQNPKRVMSGFQDRHVRYAA